MEIWTKLKAYVAPDVLVQELEGEAVLLNVKNGQYYGLDTVGTRMWTVLTSSGSLQESCGTLLAEYDVDENRLKSDVGRLVENLVEHGLLEIRDKQ